MWANNVPLLLRKWLMLSGAASGGVLPAGWGKWSFPSTQHWWGHTWSAVSSPGLHSTRKTWSYWGESDEWPQRWWRDREKGGRSARGRPGRILPMAVNTCKAGAKRMGPASFQCPDQGQRAQTGTQEVSSELQETVFLLWGWWGIYPGCPETFKSSLGLVLGNWV